MKIILKFPSQTAAFTLFESLLTGVGSVSLVIAGALLFTLWFKEYSIEKILGTVMPFVVTGILLLGYRIFLLGDWGNKKDKNDDGD